MRITELKKSLAQEALPCYLAVGDDDYLIKTAVDRIKALITSFEEMNFSCFDDGASVSEIIAAASAVPFMSPKRVVAVKNYNKDLQPLAEYLAHPSPDCVIIFTSSSVTKNFTPIIKKIEVIDCARLDENTLLKWIYKKVTAAGGSISADAANRLIFDCGRYLYRISNETDKLLDYKQGEMITLEDVANNVSPDPDFKVFELGDAVAKKNKARAMEIYYNLLEETSVAALFGMIYSHFRRMLYSVITTDKSSLAGNLGVKDYAVKMATKQAENFTPVKLKKILDILHKFDKDYKSGYISDELGMEKVMLQLLAI